MNDANPIAIESRIARLERSARWHKILNVLLGCTLAVIYLNGAEYSEKGIFGRLGADTIVAKNVIIINDDGKPVGTFGTEKNVVQLNLFRAGSDYAGLEATVNDKGVGEIALRQSKTGVMFGFAGGYADGGAFAAYDNSGTLNSIIGGGGDKGGFIRIMGRSEKPLVDIGANEHGGMIRTSQSSGRPVALMAVSEDGTGMLGTLTGSGKIAAGISTNEDGGGTVEVYANDEDLVGLLGATPDGGVVKLKNTKTGNVSTQRAPTNETATVPDKSKL